MTPFELISAFYLEHLPNAEKKGSLLSAPCPFCATQSDQPAGQIAVFLNPESYFRGYFRCSKRCLPGGFHQHFGHLLNLVPAKIPGVDPDADMHVPDVHFPSRHLSADITQFCSLMGKDQYDHFAQFGITKAPIEELKVGFNGRYLVYPYFLESGLAYAARCVKPGKEEDHFWHGNESFFTEVFRIYNVQDIERCNGGALFITEGECNLLILKELGYPAIAVPTSADLNHIATERLAHLEHVFLLVTNTPEARQSARLLATRIGFKARILTWPARMKRGEHLSHLAKTEGAELKKRVAEMLRDSKSFSPFPSPEKECRRLVEFLKKEEGKTLFGLETGFAKLDRALDGLRGINIMGGPPKAGKSCFFMQISTEIARRKTPVIYYDFENGRQKIYLRTLVRTSHLAEKKLRQGGLDATQTQTLRSSLAQFQKMLAHFQVVTDRQLNPEMMRRHIEFIKHETGKDDLLVVLDSLHKLPFKDLSERRTGIDSWLRSIEAIRDEQQVCFLVISELTRGKGGGYGEKPDLSSFKESGDIEYSADNAMVLIPSWDPLDAVSPDNRTSQLWIVASRESNPGLVAEYALDYPYWRFNEL
jgi:replicative DNA helicase